ncbi:murein biosynthesis integral membrane protein MurJ [Trinickia soli]|nr:lipid II flippase MurJ [Trinickia soli]CAB3637986.1 lipid II flippase MurJ [Trinickia soli]
MLNNVRMVTLITILAQVAAFVRTAIMAYIFGASSVVDAYNLALVVPVMIAGIVGGWVQSGFVGRYMERLTHSAEAAAQFRTAIWQLLLVIGASFALVMVVSRSLIAGTLVPANTITTLQLTEGAMAIAAWTLPLTVVSDYMGLVLNCHGRFGAAAAAPVLNAMISAGALWLWPTRDMDALVMSLLLGGAVQLGTLLLAMRRAQLHFVWEFLRLTDDVKATLKLALPIMPAVVFSNGTVMIIQMTCARLGEGAVAIYGYASRLHGAATQVLIIGISTVLLPRFAALLARNESSEIVRLLWRIGRASLMICVFVAAGVGVLGTPVVLTLLGRGHFDHVLGERVGQAWLLLTLSLFPFGLATFFAKLYQAKLRPQLLSMSSLVALIATTACCLFGYRVSGLSAVLLAPLGAQICVLAFFLWCFRREFGQGGLFPRRFESIARCVMWILPSVAVDLVIQHVLPSANSTVPVLFRGAVFTALFVASAKLGGGARWVLNTEPACPSRM